MNDIVGPTCIVDQEGLIVPSVHFETRGPSTNPEGRHTVTKPWSNNCRFYVYRSSARTQMCGEAIHSRIRNTKAMLEATRFLQIQAALCGWHLRCRVLYRIDASSIAASFKPKCVPLGDALNHCRQESKATWDRSMDPWGGDVRPMDPWGGDARPMDPWANVGCQLHSLRSSQEPLVWRMEVWLAACADYVKTTGKTSSGRPMPNNINHHTTSAAAQGAAAYLIDIYFNPISE